MNTIMVDYDLITPGQKYERIIGYVKQHAWANPLKSTWLLRTTKSAEQVLDDLLSIIDTNDKVFVTDVTGVEMTWYGLSDVVSEWIRTENPAFTSPLFR